MLVSKECWERGCSCYDDRVDKDPVEVLRRDWVGLTDEEIVGMTCECVDDGTFDMNCARDFARAIEENLKAKNS
jgi:hypothetical protein